MNPFMTTPKGFTKIAKSAYRFAPQFFACEQTNRIDGRRITSNALGNAQGTRVLALVALVGATLRLLTRNEGSSHHDCRRSPSVAPL